MARAGRNTYAYNDALGEVGGTNWQPDNDTSRWIRFCLSAHHQQAQLVRQRLDQAAHLWELLDTWVRRNGLPERVVSALHLAATGGRVRRAPYRRDENLTDDQATRDLRALVRAGMLEQHGETRGRFYLASPRRRSATSPPPRCAQRKSSTRTDGKALGPRVAAIIGAVVTGFRRAYPAWIGRRGPTSAGQRIVGDALRG